MIKTERLNGPNPDVDFDETLEEFRFKKDAVLTKTTHKEIAVGNINSSTGEVDPNFDVANDGTTTLQGFEWSYDSNNQELVLSDPDGIELMRHPKAGSTQFLQGIDVAFPFTAPEDGLTNFVNANNTTATSSGTEVGYTFSVDNQTIAQVSAESDGSGGIGDGKFIVRQAGGAAGTDEIKLEYSSGTGFTDGKIITGSGTIGIKPGNNSAYGFSDASFVPLTDGRDLGGTGFSSPWKDFYISGSVKDSNENELLGLTSNSSAVNYLDVANAATGNAPTISATGSDADVSLVLDYKGAGAVRLASNNTADTSGDIQIRDDSSGDLFSLQNENIEGTGRDNIDVRYEGDSAFTIGHRRNSVGTSSIVVGGQVDEPSEGQLIFSNSAEGTNSIAIGHAIDVTAGGGVGIGSSHTVDGFGSIALGSVVTTTATDSIGIGEIIDVTAENSIGLGSEILSRVYGGLVAGFWNEDYVGAGNEATGLGELVNSDRIFAVGVGDDGSAFDGRGRIDGLYVTMRDGTFVRHGLTVDRYDSGTSSYQKSAEITEPGSLILSGAITKGTTNLVSSDYTTSATDYYIGVDTTTGAHVVTVRSADIEDGREIVIHDQGGNASGNNVTVQTEGSETISGAQYGSDLASITMDTDNESVTLRGAIDNQSTGETNLYVV